MAIPTAKIPVIKAPTQVAPPKIYTAQVPSIPLLGSPASEYRNYLQQKADRSSRFFNINDPNQINSVADVVMKTVEGLWNSAKGEDTLGNTFRETIDNSWSLVNNGIIQPIVHGDWAALGLNQLVNVGETIDIVDNIWKGMLMDGTEGIYNASFGRQNYEWDTGNGVVDFMLEMATPTNLAVLGLGGLAKGAVKKAAEETGSTLSKKVLKKFARAYDGNIDTTLLKMQKGINLTANQVTQLKDISVHATNLKLLKSLNTMRAGANIIDDIGPKLVYGSTFLPFKQLVKFGFTGVGAAQKYIAQQLDSLSTNITTVNLVKDSAKYGVAIKTLADAAKIADVENIDIAPFEDILSNVSKLEVKALKSLYKEFSTTAIDKKLIYNLIEQEQYISGQAISFEVAQQMHISQRANDFAVKLDDLAVQLSDGYYQTFAEYSAAISRLYNSDASGVGLKELYEYTQKIKQVASVTSASLITQAFSRASRTLSDIDVVVSRTVMKSDKMFRSEVLEELADLTDTLKANPKDMETLKRLAELQDEYSAELIDGVWSIPDFGAKVIDVNVPQDPVTYDAMLKIFNSRHFTIRSIEDAYRDAREILMNINADMLGSGKMLEDLNKHIDTSLKEIAHLKNTYRHADKMPGVKQINALEDTRISPELLGKFFKDFNKMTAELQKTLDNVNAVLIDRTTQESFERILKEIIGGAGDGQKAMDQLLETVQVRLGKYRTTALQRAIKEAIMVDGAVDRVKVLDLQKDLRDLQAHMVGFAEYIGEDLGDSALLKAITEEMKLDLSELRREVMELALVDDKGVVDAIANIIPRLDNITLTAQRALKSIDESNLRAGITTRYRQTIGNADATAAISEKFESSFIDMSMTKSSDPLFGIFDKLGLGDIYWSQVRPQIAGYEQANTLKRLEDVMYTSDLGIFWATIKPELDAIPTARTVSMTAAVKADVVDAFLPDNVVALKNVIDMIDEIKATIAVDPTTELRATVNNIREYQLQMNAVYRNMLILGTEAVQRMLNMIDDGPNAYDPALQAIDAISNFDMGTWSAMMDAITNGKFDVVTELYAKITQGRGVYPVDEAGRQVFNDSIKELFDEIQEIQQASLMVMDTLHGMASVRKLYTLIDSKSMVMGKDITRHLMDALQRYYDAPSTLTLNDDMAEILTEIKENINNQLRNSDNRHSFKLELWRQHVPKEAQAAYDAMFPGDMAHTAIADSYAEYLIRKHVLGTDTLPDTKIVYVDLETSTLNKFSSTVHQHSVVIPEAGIYRWYINANVEPGQYASDEVLRILFDDKKNPQYDIAYLRNLYNEVHINGNMEALRNHYNLPADSPIEIIPVYKVVDSHGDVVMGSEANLIMMAEDYIKSQSPGQGHMKIAMFNGKDYDAELLANRRKALGISGWINKEDILDTRIELEDLYGINKLKPEQEEAIEDIIYDYIDIRRLELSANASRRENMLSHYYNTLGTGKFIPTVDKSFRDALNRINRYFGTPLTSKTGGASELAEQYDIHTNVMTHRATHHAMKELNDFVDDITKSTGSLEELQDALGELHLIAADHDEAGEITNFTQRLINADYFKDVDPALADRLNIGIDLMTTNRIDGMYVPALGVRKILDHDVVLKWFDVQPNTKMSRALLERMTTVGGSVSKTLSKIKNGDALTLYTVKAGVLESRPEQAMAELIEIQKLILDEITTLKGATRLSPVLSTLRPRTNLIEQYAVVHEIWKTYKSISYDMRADDNEYLALYDKLSKIYPDRMADIHHSRRILHGIIGDTTHARVFKLEPPDTDMQAMIEYFERTSDMSKRTLEAHEAIIDETLSASRLKRMVPVYNKLHESFRIAREIAENTSQKEQVYAYLRMPMEAINEIIGYQKLVDVLSKAPASMASYLWHQANGVIAFKDSDLITRNYFKKRNGINSVDVLDSEDALLRWKDITDNKAAYEAAGISFKSHEGWTFMYIKEENVDKFKDLAFERPTYDYDLTEDMDRFIMAYQEAYDNLNVNINDVRKLVTSTLEARKHLIDMTPDGLTSTLEHMDSKVMSDLLRRIDVRLPGVVGIDTLRANYRFDGNMYNHSILGAVDSRRELMPFTSFTPAKTMFHSAELAHDRISKQMQFTMLLQDPNMQLRHIAADMTPDEIFQYLQNAPHLKLAFLQPHKKKGYKVSAVIINSPKDVQWALDVGAVVLDRNTYVKAYEIINQNQIPEGFLKFLDHAIIAPFKISWMAYNVGTVFRNFADSGLKNVQSTGDLRIIPEMTAMFKTYWDYKKDIKEIMQYMQSKNIQMDRAILEYFEAGKNRVSLEDFMMIDEFKKSGSSSGMVREMQEYYGDAIQRLYRKVGELDSGLSKEEFRELMRLPEAEIETWMRRMPQLTEVQIRNVLTAKADLYYYKRAYNMHKRKTPATKHLSVEDFVVYLKRGNVDGFIPQEILGDMEKLMDATKDVSINETMFERIMAHPLVDQALDLNAGVEEVMRLAMFKHLKSEGYSVAEAMNEIIKTHFDYGHKSQAQMYLEMAAPFSTFRINSFLYWVDQLSRSSMGMEIVSKYWRESSNVDERDPEDYYLRRGLQYQMLSGNPVLNEESGLTLKLSPSVMDAMEFVRDPIGYAGRSLFMVEEVKTFIEMEPYAGESEERYKERKRLAASKLIPVVGSIYAREVGSVRTLPILNQLIAPLVNRTWTPEQRVQKPRFYYAQNQKSRYAAAKIRRARFSSYSPFNKIYYGAMYRTRNGIPYGTKAFRSVNRWHKSAWSRTMSSKHKQKYALLSFPTNKYTLKMKVQLLRRLAAVR